MKKLFSLFVLVAALAAASAEANGDVAAGKSKSATCAACHGADGNSSNPQWPKLAGQHASYLTEQLRHFKSGARKNAMMSAMGSQLSDQDQLDLAAYFSSQQLQFGTTKATLLALGAKIYRGGNAASGVPACMACHGPSGAGNGPALYPALHGQHAEYVTKTLNDYASGARTGGKAEIMQGIASRLSASEIEAVSSYVSGLH